MEYTKLLVGQGKVGCRLEAVQSDDCEDSFDECVEDIPAEAEVSTSSAGVVYGKQECLDFFMDGDFDDCDVAAEDYIACIQEEQEALNSMDSDDACDESDGDDDELSDACQKVLEDCEENPFTATTIMEYVEED